MANAVTMPALGESVTEGTVTAWLKQVGDTVEVDEPIVEVSTDKVDSEVPSPVAGTVVKILVEEDETVDVGTELCLVGDADEADGDDGGSDEEAEPTPKEETDGPQEEAKEAKEEKSGDDSGDGSQPEGTEVLMPALGESVTEGTVSAWLKSEGDKVEADEPILEVSTDKVDSEVPSPASGYLVKIMVDEDETVDVGTVVAIIGATPDAGAGSDEPKEEPKEEEKEEPKEDKKSAPEAPSKPEPPKKPEPKESKDTDEGKKDERPAPKHAAKPVAAAASGTYVTPLVRKLAKEKNVDLSELTGSGVGGRIQKSDVLEAAKRAEEEAAKASSPKPDEAPAKPAKSPKVEVDTTLRGKTEKMSRLRQTIAKRMHQSLQESAQLTTVVEVDVTRVAALRARAKDGFAQREGTKLTFLPFFVKAATEALKMHPKLNASINGKEVTYYDHEHIGIAVDTPRGLLVPVIKNAGDLTLSGIAKSINDLAKRTREASIGADELSGSTFTITNTGSGGALFDTPVLNSPEVGILGVGTIVKRPTVVKDAEGNETIGIRSMVYLALSYDHQLVDGADAARYLMTVKKRLEEAEFEGELGL